MPDMDFDGDIMSFMMNEAYVEMSGSNQCDNNFSMKFRSRDVEKLIDGETADLEGTMTYEGPDLEGMEALFTDFQIVCVTKYDSSYASRDLETLVGRTYRQSIREELEKDNVSFNFETLDCVGTYDVRQRAIGSCGVFATADDAVVTYYYTLNVLDYDKDGNPIYTADRNVVHED